jgi:hypothetical protein
VAGVTGATGPPGSGAGSTVTTGIIANNTTQGTATVLTTQDNYVATVGVNGAVKIPAALMTAGNLILVVNEQTVNALNLFGDTGVAINGQAANTPISIPAAVGTSRQSAFIKVKDATHLSTIP